MRRINRFLWRFWAIVSLVWVAIVLNMFGENRPTLAQVLLAVSTRETPFNAYLATTAERCKLVTTQEAETMDKPVDPKPDYDPNAVPADQREAVFEAWSNDMMEHALRQGSVTSDGRLLACDPQDYVAAAKVRSKEMLPRSEAKAKVAQFLNWLLGVPLTLIAMGIFIFWSPFRGRSDESS